ncbi:hypothetical protein LMG33818_002610 [Halomonadaceae bacterium LMG 33818]|uniref:contractile injection system protein, VgrG/Pvc8 family n=1 Tax=Cernens ardua TaxID=3402176 RepID=UPI003EDC2D2F
MSIGYLPSSDNVGNRQPSYQIILAGVDITPRFNGRLVSLELTETRDGTSDQLDITLTDHDGRTPLPKNGQTLTLAIGWTNNLIDKGQYIINEVQMSGPPDTITVRARAVDTTKTLRGQHTKSWHLTTIGDIVRDIAHMHSLTPACAQAFQGIRVKHIDQTSESDLNFLNRLGYRYDAIATVKSGRLMFVQRGQSITASGQTLPTIDVSPQECSRYTYIRTVAESFTGVKANYNDRSGATLKYVIAGSGENLRELKATYATLDDATNAAEAAWNRIKRGEEELDISFTEGRADILVESPIKASGFKPAINEAKWVTTEATHRLSSSGYLTNIRCEVVV